MDKDSCGSSVLWNIFPYIPLGGVVLPVCFWNFIPVLLCAMDYCLSYSVDWYLKMRFYWVPPGPFNRYCQGFGFLWKSFVVTWVLISQKDARSSHINQCYVPSDGRLVASLINIELHTCVIVEGV